MAYKVEREFEHAGYKCVMIFTEGGYRCGYVGMPRGSKLFGANYGEVDVRVHGGLTYCGGGEDSEYPIKSNLWWLGFDCAHWGDGKELKRAWELFPEKRGQIQIQIQIEREIFGEEGNTEDVIRSEEYVAEECKRLAEQIREYEGR